MRNPKIEIELKSGARVTLRIAAIVAIEQNHGPLSSCTIYAGNSKSYVTCRDYRQLVEEIETIEREEEEAAEIRADMRAIERAKRAREAANPTPSKTSDRQS